MCLRSLSQYAMQVCYENKVDPLTYAALEPLAGKVTNIINKSTAFNYVSLPWHMNYTAFKIMGTREESLNFNTSLWFKVQSAA